MTATVDRPLTARGWYLLAALSALGYLLAALALVDHTPKYDDLNDVFGFFRQLALAETPLQHVAAFFYPNNEHITLFNHLLYYAQYQLLGEIRFAPLVITGHLLVLATACLLGLALVSPYRPFAVAMLLLAYPTLHYWDSTFKAMTALSNQGVILFGLAALFALHHQRPWLAALLGTLATLTQGNGLLVWPAGVLLLWLARAGLQRATWVWLGGALLAISFYSAARLHFADPAAPAPDAWAAILAAPWLPWQSGFALLGNLGVPRTHSTLATVLGLLVVLAGAVQLPRWRQQPLLAACLGFLLASAFAAGALRGLAYGDAGAVLESRYRMYPVACLGLALLLWLDSAPGTRRLWPAALGLIGGLWLQASSVTVPETVRLQADRFATSYRHWLVDGDFRHQAAYFPPMSDHFLFVAEHLQLFDFSRLAEPGSWLSPHPLAPGSPCRPLPEPSGQCPLTLHHRGNAIAVALTLADGAERPAAPLQLVLCDTAGAPHSAWMVPSKPGLRRWYLPTSAVPAGDYRAIITAGEQHCTQAFTRKPRTVDAEMQQLFGQ